MKSSLFAISAITTVVIAATTACSSGDEPAQAERSGDLAVIDVAVLESPSITSFYAPILAEKGFDEANGLDISFTPKTAVALRTEMANGSTQVSAGATVLTDVALLNQQGADNEYLFNVFDWWGTIATPAGSDIQTVDDLTGQKILGALSTTNYAMAKMSMGLSGVDLATLQESSAEPAGLIAAAKSGRENAVQIWEPAYTVLTQGNDDFRAIDIVTPMKEATGLERVPYVGVAAQRSWVEANADLLQPLYKTFADTADFIKQNPDEAAQLISAATDIDVAAVTDLLNKPDHVAIDVYPAIDASEELNVLLDAAVEYGILEAKPELADLVYSGELTR